MMRNPWFNDVLALMLQTHDRKNHDYATDKNPFSNFEAAAQFAGVSVQTVFDVLLGVKQARLAELTSTTKEPNYESIEDTRLDRAVYAALAVAYEAYRYSGTGSPYDVTPGQMWEETVYPLMVIPAQVERFDQEEVGFKRLLEAQEMERAEHDDDA